MYFFDVYFFFHRYFAAKSCTGTPKQIQPVQKGRELEEVEKQWFKAVVLNHGLGSHMRLPKTFCAALRSFNTTFNILCSRLRSAVKQNVSIDLF